MKLNIGNFGDNKPAFFMKSDNIVTVNTDRPISDFLFSGNNNKELPYRAIPFVAKAKVEFETRDKKDLSPHDVLEMMENTMASMYKNLGDVKPIKAIRLQKHYKGLRKKKGTKTK